MRVRFQDSLKLKAILASSIGMSSLVHIVLNSSKCLQRNRLIDYAQCCFSLAEEITKIKEIWFNDNENFFFLSFKGLRKFTEGLKVLLLLLTR